MATLFERLVGLVPANAGPSESRIPLHGFRVVMKRYLEGELSGAQVVAEWSLDGPQIARLQTLVSTIQAIPTLAARRQFIDWLFDDLLMAELGWWPEVYRSEAAFNARFVAEATRAGA